MISIASRFPLPPVTAAAAAARSLCVLAVDLWL